MPAKAIPVRQEKAFVKRTQSIMTQLRKERVFMLAWTGISILVAVALLVYYIEGANPKSNIKSLGDALWWAVVTAATVGYGDKFPVSGAGKLVSSVFILSWVMFFAVVSATVTSFFVEKKIKEGKGLEAVKDKEHLVICGWNANAEKILEALQRYKRFKTVALVNELEENRVNQLASLYTGFQLKWVNGNYTQEAVLQRANVAQAKTVILLADMSGPGGIEKADERSIIAAHSIRFLSSEVRVCVELVDGANEQHLRRTEVDDIVVGSDYGGFLLAQSALSPGVSQAVKDLLSFEKENEFTRVPIPKQFVGSTFLDLSGYFQSEDAILVGILSEDKGMKLSDILTDDTSAIDQFIKKKFQEANLETLTSGSGKFQIKINPGNNYAVRENDEALVIQAKEV